MIEFITPKNKEEWLKLRLQDVTSTEVSALFGLNPYMTEFELWHQKKNQTIVTLDENDRMFWGNLMEPVIAQGIAAKKGWTIQPLKDYGRDPELKMGSSFDYKIVKYGSPDVILEIKNVDSLIYSQKWHEEDGYIEAPPHIELQVQHQLAITGAPKAYIGVLVGGNDLKVIPRKPDENIINQIKKKVQEFNQSVTDNNPPEPDFINDHELISKMYSNVEPDKIMDSTTEDLDSLVEAYNDTSKEIEDLETVKKGIKSKILISIGDHERIYGNGYTISAGYVGPSEVSFTRKGYRNLRVHKKKGKKE